MAHIAEYKDIRAKVLIFKFSFLKTNVDTEIYLCMK